MSTSSRYTRTAVVLHWLIAIGIVGLFLLGWFMTDLPKEAPQQSAFDLFNWGLYTLQLPEAVSPRAFYYNLHKSIGVSILVLVAVRILWRLTHQPPPPLTTYKPWESKLFRAVQHLLYLLMAILPISGVLMSINGKYGVQWFGIPLLSGNANKGWFDFFEEAHYLIGIILLVALGLHLAGALKHHFYDKDETLRRML